MKPYLIYLSILAALAQANVAEAGEAEIQIKTPTNGTWLVASEEPDELKVEGIGPANSEIQLRIDGYLDPENSSRILKTDKQGKFATSLDQMNIPENGKTKLIFSTKNFQKTIEIFCCSNDEGFYDEPKFGSDYSVDVKRPGTEFDSIGIRIKKEVLEKSAYVMVSTVSFEADVAKDKYIPLTKAFGVVSRRISEPSNMKLILPLHELKPRGPIATDESVSLWEDIYEQTWQSFTKAKTDKVVLGFGHGTQIWKEIPSTKQPGDRYMIDLSSCKSCDTYLIASKNPKKPATKP